MKPYCFFIDEPIQKELLELDFGMHIDVENLLISQSCFEDIVTEAHHHNYRNINSHPDSFEKELLRNFF